MSEKRRPKIPSQDRLERQAVYYLERYASSADNLRKVLERKVYKACMAHDLAPESYAEAIDAVVDKAVQTGLVNDRAYAETKIASLRRRGKSALRIVAFLKSKGIDGALIDELLETSEDTDGAAAWAYAKRRRLGPYRRAEHRADRRTKDLAALVRAGFSYGLAQTIIDADADETDGAPD
ncbi:regulatory protein RecX [Roseibium denhamense]|nr:regulatory protein RecX [Roseibium denhamense]MTI07844.1 regulatory protein RecX [Roseibium denhamense]